MKRLIKLISVFLLGLTLTSCQQPDYTSIIIAILNAPLTYFKDEKIECNKKYDYSDYKGRKAFLVVMNNSANGEIVYETKPSDNTLNYDYKFTNENGTFYNVPFNPPRIDIDLTEVSDISFNRNIMKSEAPLEVGTKKDFYGATKENTTNDDYAKQSELKVVGNHCYVWYKEKDGITITDEQLKTLADTFDSLYEKETYIFGSNIPTKQYGNIITVNRNTKINIIVYDLFDDYLETKETNGGTMGYFWALDFYTNNLSSDLKSNKCECLHLDSFFLETAAQNQRSTIAHEFQHLLNFVNKDLNNGNDATSATWFNEMMSMICEDIMQTQLGLSDSQGPKGRLNQFNSVYRYGFTDWLDDDEVLISYANAYAFGAYLVRNYGIDFIRELAKNNTSNKEAITNALIAINAEEKSFDETYEKFYNVVLNPKADKYTLNRTVESTYTYAAEKTATFTCTAINLANYLTCKQSSITDEIESNIYNASKSYDYYGPVIWNKKLITSLPGSGMWISYLGIIGADMKTSFELTNNASPSNKVIYRIVITN